MHLIEDDHCKEINHAVCWACLYIKQGINISMIKFSLALLLAFPLLANAEPYMVLGRTIDIVPPPGYCVLGKTKAEQEYVNNYKEISKSGLELLQASVPCTDLKKFNANMLNQFPRTSLVSVVKAKGKLILETSTPKESLSRIGGGMQTVDIDAVNSRLRKALADKNFAASMSRVTPLGSDGNAFYFAILGSVQPDGMPLQQVTSVSAALLINKLPLNVQASESVIVKNAAAPASIVQKQVESIISRNN